MEERSRAQQLAAAPYSPSSPPSAGEVPEGTGSAESSSPAKLIGGRYRLQRQIGRGRLGDIYEAVDESNRELGVERRVALQLIRGTITAERRFVDELRRGFTALRESAHPHIVAILDFGRDGKTFFVAMELLEGASLRIVLDQAAPDGLSFPEAAAVVRAVGDALRHLHAKAMLHGGLRPESVFVTEDYAVKLLDIAPLHLRSELPYYVEDSEPRAPRARDPRDDVYGLACLAYELLTGRHPFNANSPLEASRAGLVPAPLEELSEAQWRALARGLALERAERTKSVAEFLSELGITGTERLPVADNAATPADREGPAAAEPAAVASPEPPFAAVPPPPVDADVEAPPPAAQPFEPRTFRRPAPSAFEGFGDEPLDAPYEPLLRTRGGFPRQRRSAFGTLLALAAVAGVGTFVYLRYESLQERAADLMVTAAAARRP